MRLKYVFVDFIAGTSITSACSDALWHSKNNQIQVRFNFNGVEMQIEPSHSLPEIIDYYHMKITSH